MEELKISKLAEAVAGKQKLNGRKVAQLEGWLSLFINVILFGFKYWVGVSSMSLALIADAWHTLSDSLTSMIVLLSERVSHRPADREHPYGHGRAELIAALIIGVLLALVSVEFLREGILRLRSGTGTRYGQNALIVTGVSVFVKTILGELSKRWGRKYDLASLIADGHHHTSDALSSLVILAGIAAGSFVDLWWMDGFLSGVVAILIGYAAYGVIMEAADRLLGRCIDEKQRQKIEEICNESANVRGVSLEPHHFHLHRYGEHQELTFHVRMPGNWEIAEGHAVLIEIEDRIREVLGIEATIHIDPREDR